MRAWLAPLSAGAARRAYSLLLRLALPLFLLRLWRRGAKEPLYRAFVAERLGLGAASAPGAVWVHAVSLGETRAAAPLIEALRSQRPGMRLLLTHGTASGRQAGRTLLQAGDAQAWLPYDTPGAVRRFLRRHRPVLGLVMETEVWPNLMHGAQTAGVPMVLANARLSEKSRIRGAQLAALLHPALARFAAVLAQTESDAERLRASGARQVQVLGNLKFDMAPSPALLAQGRQWRAALARPVVLAAALREGEDEPLLRAWSSLPQPRPLLLLVPRHPQRFDEVAARVAQAGLRYARRSAWPQTPPASALERDVDVWLGDSLGEMPLFYAAADIALLGGSFARLGGQNLIESAACGCPLILGPHTFNFAQAAELALAAGAALRVDDMAQAVERAAALIDSPARARMVQQALQFAAQHKGAALRMAQASLALIAPPALL